MDIQTRQAHIVYQRLKNRSKTGILIIISVFALSIVMAFLFNFGSLVSKESRLILKTVLFILFFGTIPLVFYRIRYRIRTFPASLAFKEKLKIYARLYSIAFVVYTILSVLAVLGFLFSQDPLILILMFAGLFFVYYERPGKYKILEDLILSSNNEENSR